MTTVLVAVRHPALERVVEHLLRSRPGLSLRAVEGNLLVRPAGRLAPDLIVAHSRCLGREWGERIAGVKGSSPGSRLLIITPLAGLGPAVRRWGADACVREESLVLGLLSALSRLARRPR